MHKIISIIAVGTFALTMILSCGMTSVPQHEAAYYEGRLSYDTATGAVIFTECTTMQTMLVDDVERLNEKFAHLRTAQNKNTLTLMVEFRGRRIIQDNPTGVPGAVMHRIIIDTLINAVGITPDNDCRNHYMLSGIYESAGSVRKLLRLKPDYTFELTTYPTDNNELSLSGIWFRPERLGLTLEYSETGERESMNIHPWSESLVGSSGEGEFELRKVYLN